MEAAGSYGTVNFCYGAISLICLVYNVKSPWASPIKGILWCATRALRRLFDHDTLSSVCRRMLMECSLPGRNVRAARKGGRLSERSEF